MSIDIRYETFVENENHLQNLEYVGIKNNTFKTKIDEILKYNFWVFTSTLSRKTKVFPNGLQGARMSPCASKMCFLMKMVRSTLLCLLSESPFGQNFGFNANVLFFKNIHVN